jgi:thymidylate kinase
MIEPTLTAAATARDGLLRVAARIASPYHVEDLSRHDSVTLHGVGLLLERQKVSFIPIVARYGPVMETTPLAEFVKRDLSRFRAQRDEFEHIRTRLATDHVDTMLFKSTGMSPSFHYQSSNLDVLVLDGRAGAARTALEEMGYVELLNVEEPQKLLFRRFVGDGSSFAFHLHEVVGWGVPFLDNGPIWRYARHATDDPDIVIPGPSEALLITLAHWFYEDKALTLGNLLLTAHALRSMDAALGEPATHARGRGWEEGFWGALHIFEDTWKYLFGEGFLTTEQQAELARAPVRYAAVRARLIPYVRFGESDLPAQIPFRPAKVAYYRKVMRDRRRSDPRKWVDVIDTLLWAVRWKWHIRSQPGLLVSVSGIDGSGKSLQVERLRGAFETCDVRVRCIWARGASSKGVGTVMRAGKSVLGSPSERDDTPTPQAIAEAARAHGAASYGEAARFAERQRRLKNPIVRWVFGVIYALDLVWPYVVRARAYVLTGHVTICDRYIYDALVDYALFTGTQTSKPPLALHILRTLVPRPRVAFVLDVEAAEALRRKPEEGGLAHLAAGRTMFLEIAESHRLDVMPSGASAEENQRTMARTALRAFYARYGTVINWLLRSNPGQMNPRPEPTSLSPASRAIPE